MARSYAPLLCAIWTDETFVALPAHAQRVYLLAISQPNLSYCGVIPYTEKRWARLAADTTPGLVADAVSVLEDADFVLLDAETEELWVRSFVKHNKVNEQSQLHRALAAAFDAIVSPTIRSAAYGTLGEGAKKHVRSRVTPCAPALDTPAPNPGPGSLKDLDLEPGTLSSSSSHCEEPAPDHPDEEDGWLISRVARILAERELARQPPGTVRVARRWLDATQVERMERHAAALGTLVAAYPDASAEDFADLLEPDPSRPKPVLQRVYHCDTCKDEGQVRNDDDLDRPAMVPCPSCAALHGEKESA